MLIGGKGGCHKGVLGGGVRGGWGGGRVTVAGLGLYGGKELGL